MTEYTALTTESYFWLNLNPASGFGTTDAIAEQIHMAPRLRPLAKWSDCDTVLVHRLHCVFCDCSGLGVLR